MADTIAAAPQGRGHPGPAGSDTGRPLSPWAGRSALWECPFLPGCLRRRGGTLPAPPVPAARDTARGRPATALGAEPRQERERDREWGGKGTREGYRERDRERDKE